MLKTRSKPYLPAATDDASGVNDRHSTLTATWRDSAIEVETMDSYPSEFSFPSFLEEIVSLCRIRAQGKGITFVYHNRYCLPDLVRADSQQLRQVLEHLLNHAIEITDIGGVTFTVEVLGQLSPSEIPQPHSQLRFQVEDMGGDGTTEALKWDTSDAADSSDSDTTGCGEFGSLQPLLRLMGSRLHTHNLPGVGSLRWMDVTFPATCYVPEPAIAPMPDSATSGGASQSVQPLRILLAEDIPVNQKLALRILKRLGYEADLATNGVEVLDALERQFYDVVFMDVQMPKMDGLEATRRIRQDLTSDRHPWIIALTANVASGDRDACLAVGMNDYLSKPIDLEALERSLRQCLARVDRSVANQAKI